MAVITIKQVVHGSFSAVAQQAISEYRQKGVSSVEFTFNDNVYTIGNDTTLEALMVELFNQGN